MGDLSIKNETPSQLTLQGVGGARLVLSPLQVKVITPTPALDFTRAEQLSLVSTRKEAPPEVGTWIATGIFWGVILAWGVSAAGPFFGLSEAQWSWTVWIGAALVLVTIVLGVFIGVTHSLALVTRFTLQVAALTMILAIGLGLPFATMYYFGGGQALLTEPSPSPLALFGRLLQLAFIATASLLPVLLFFLFDHFRLATLRRRLYAALFRLDPAMNTYADVDAKYGAQITEEYGMENQGRGRLAPGSRWPVLVCAFIVTMGWIVALAPVDDAFNPTSIAEVMSALAPQPTPLVFGFLGAYFFSLRLIALRYARGDLKPKAYSYIMVRVVIVSVLSWVLAILFPEESSLVLLLAFLFGITPDEFFTFLKEGFRGKGLPGVQAWVPASLVPASTTLPLKDIEGIDLFDRGRLESEGIVNIEGLAHHELVDLIIETRIPVPRLVDWVDQAILYLHLTGSADGDARSVLRGYGIRTASDLLQAWEAAEVRGADEFLAFKSLLGGTPTLWRLEVIRDALSDDEWLGEVMAWRLNEPRPPLVVDARPVGEEALLELADEQCRNHQYSAALHTLEEALEQGDSAAVRLRLARLLGTSPVKGLIDVARARDNARRAYELAADDVGVLTELIDIHAALDDATEVERLCNVARRIIERWSDGKARDRALADIETHRQKIETRMPAPSDAA